MTDDRPEISIFDIADWLWSFRWLMLACAAIAIIWATLAWQTSKSAVQSYEVRLQIYSGGTPLRSPGEIADIVAAGLSIPMATLVSPPSANPVIFLTDDRQKAERIGAELAPLTEAMIAEAGALKIELERLLLTNENALPQYLKTKAFLEGVNSGIVPLIVTSVTPAAGSTRSLMRIILIPVLSCGCLFLLAAGATSFIVEWKKRRADFHRPGTS